MIKRLMSAFGWVRKEELTAMNGKLFAAGLREGTLMGRNRELMRERDDLRRLLVEKEAQYADAVSRWAGLARLWQEEHGGGLVYVKEEAGGGVQVWDEAVGDGCEPSAVIELKPIGKAVADGGDEECEVKIDTSN